MVDESVSDFFDSGDADSEDADDEDSDSEDAYNYDIESDDSDDDALREISGIKCALKEMLSNMLEFSKSRIPFIRYLIENHVILDSNLRGLFSRLFDYRRLLTSDLDLFDEILGDLEEIVDACDWLYGKIEDLIKQRGIMQDVVLCRRFQRLNRNLSGYKYLFVILTKIRNLL
ncbi:unnamed protein product [Hymenolepis diminuta]|nr:unnamed protein product [Hymenolepis diminuta]